MSKDPTEALRWLSDAASPDWTLAERGITRVVRERPNGPQVGNFICEEDAEFAVAAVNYARAALAAQPAEGLDVELRELGDQWFEGVGPGPWTPENRAGGPITLHNSNGDLLFVYSADAALLINRLARVYAEDSND